MIAVQRFDPKTDERPVWATYSVNVAPSQTVLDALLVVAETIDPTLAFRRTCRSGICGACAGTINGQPRLFCQAMVGGMRSSGARPASVPSGVEAEIFVQPLSQFRVLKDLVVDMGPFFDAFERAQAWLVPSARYDGLMSKDVFRRLWGATSCVLCGICVGRAAAPDLSHPAAVARVLRLACDPRDELGETRLALLDQPERYDAEWAEALKTACPKAVDVSGLLPGE